MNGKHEIGLVSAELHDNGILVTFADGKLAFYSGALLRSIFPQAEELHGTLEDAEEDRKSLSQRRR